MNFLFFWFLIVRNLPRYLKHLEAFKVNISFLGFHILRNGHNLVRLYAAGLLIYTCLYLGRLVFYYQSSFGSRIERFGARIISYNLSRKDILSTTFLMLQMLFGQTRFRCSQSFEKTKLRNVECTQVLSSAVIERFPVNNVY